MRTNADVSRRARGRSHCKPEEDRRDHGDEIRRPEEPAPSFHPVRGSGQHARHDGHGPEPRAQRRHSQGPCRTDRQRMVRVRLLPALRRHVRRRGPWPQAGEQRKSKTPSRRSSTQRRKQRGIKLDIEFTVDDLKDLVDELQGCHQEATQCRLSRRPDGAALGRHRRRLQVLEERSGHRLPEAEQHPCLLGHRGQRAVHGLRQHRQGFGYGCCLHKEPIDRRQRLLRRVSAQRPGRGRGGRHQDTAAHQQEAEERLRNPVPRGRDARGSMQIFSRSGTSSRSTTATCRT